MTGKEEATGTDKLPVRAASPSPAGPISRLGVAIGIVLEMQMVQELA
jgi:hypothetical protein